jgi:hypothetical protein
MTGVGMILPPRMTAEEARGFRMACACFATWGYQLAGDPTLAGSTAVDDVRARFRQHGRVVTAMAAALDRQIGRAAGTPEIPVEAVVEMARL